MTSELESLCVGILVCLGYVLFHKLLLAAVGLSEGLEIFSSGLSSGIAERLSFRLRVDGADGWLGCNQASSLIPCVILPVRILYYELKGLSSFTRPEIRKLQV